MPRTLPGNSEWGRTARRFSRRYRMEKFETPKGVLCAWVLCLKEWHRRSAYGFDVYALDHGEIPVAVHMSGTAAQFFTGVVIPHRYFLSRPESNPIGLNDFTMADEAQMDIISSQNFQTRVYRGNGIVPVPQEQLVAMTEWFWRKKVWER